MNHCNNVVVQRINNAVKNCQKFLSGKRKERGDLGMRRRMVITILFTAALLFLFNGITNAQEGKSKGEWRVLKLENEHVRVVEVTLQPGQKTDAHTHPSHFIYVFKGGKIEVDMVEGDTQIWELPDGEVMWSDPEGMHVTTNVGDTLVKFLLVELPKLK